jgi:hypothetical protein
MSEPKWWPMGEIPTEDGNYLCRFDGRVSCWVFHKDRPLKFELGQFYGPIPEPPKEPPKLRQFTATHPIYGRVTGAYFPEKNSGTARKHQIFFWEDERFEYVWLNECSLSDIKFIDKE